jgi:hypothetical protein
MVTTTIRPDTDAPARPARAAAPPLRAPEAADAWRVAPTAHAPPPDRDEARLGSGEHLLVEPQPSGRGTLISGMVLAVCIVAAVLGGMAVLSHGNGDHPPAQSAGLPSR